MRGAKRREQIMGVAAELFAEKGYHATNIGEIVTRAGVARGTFYLYFKDKRTIFEELVDGFIGEIDNALIRIDPELGADACLEMMRENIRLVFEICIRQRALTKILLSAAVGLDAEFDQARMNRRLFQRIVRPRRDIGGRRHQRYLAALRDQ